MAAPPHTEMETRSPQLADCSGLGPLLSHVCPNTSCCPPTTASTTPTSVPTPPYLTVPQASQTHSLLSCFAFAVPPQNHRPRIKCYLLREAFWAACTSWYFHPLHGSQTLSFSLLSTYIIDLHYTSLLMYIHLRIACVSQLSVSSLG